jgi:hypothetical protein
LTIGCLTFRLAAILEDLTLEKGFGNCLVAQVRHVRHIFYGELVIQKKITENSIGDRLRVELRDLFER